MSSSDRWWQQRTRHGSMLAAAAVCIAVLASAAGAAATPSTPEASASARLRTRALAFEPNRGQTDPQVRFIARGSDYMTFLTATEAVIVPRGRSDADPKDATVVRRLRAAGAILVAKANTFQFACSPPHPDYGPTRKLRPSKLTMSPTS